MDGTTAVDDRKTLPSTAACVLAYGPNDEHRCEWDGQPVPAGRASTWCSDRCARAFHEAHVWNAARAAARARAAGRCEICGTRPAQVHHIDPADDYGPGCQHHAGNLAMRCKAHHAHEHRCLRAKPGTQLDLGIAA